MQNINSAQCTEFSWCWFREPAASFQGQCHGGHSGGFSDKSKVSTVATAVLQPKVAIIAGTRLIFHFLAVLPPPLLSVVLHNTALGRCLKWGVDWMGPYQAAGS